MLGLAARADAKCCVWKVTSSTGTLYIAGSVHALRSSDYPLPAAYDQAFARSTELYFETDPYASAQTWSKQLSHASALPAGTTFKDKVDPRTYAYIQQVMKQIKGSTAPEKKIEHLRPWALAWLLESPGGTPDVTGSYGVETYLQNKARKVHKRMAGLVDLKQHIATFGGMSDADSETFLLLQFIHLDTESAEFNEILSGWKRGDIDTIDRLMRGDYRDSPSLYRRIVTDRNRLWLPKLEGFLRDSHQTRMVVVGAAHTAGGEGLPALLQAKGYQVEQF